MSTDCPFHQLPMANSKNFITTLLDLCIKKKINVLLPLVTKELFGLSTHKKKFFEKGIKVIVSDEDALFLMNNKCLLYQHLKNNKVDVPKFFIANNNTVSLVDVSLSTVIELNEFSTDFNNILSKRFFDKCDDLMTFI